MEMSPIQEAKTIPGVLKPSPDAPRKPRKGSRLFMRPLDLDAGYLVCRCMRARVLPSALPGRSSKTFLRSLKKSTIPRQPRIPAVNLSWRTQPAVSLYLTTQLIGCQTVKSRQSNGCCSQVPGPLPRVLWPQIFALSQKPVLTSPRIPMNE